MSDGPSHLLYLHGFRSSPLSVKALRVHDWLRKHRPELHWWCPQLPPSPRAAMAQIEQVLVSWPAGCFAVMGSSLGGFYATCVAERHACPAVLLNPAVNPARDLAAHIGEHTAYHNPAERFFFHADYVDELRALAPANITRPERYLAVIAKGDELLDWREMRARFDGSSLLLIEGSDHGLSDFDDHLPAILRFLQLNP